MQGTHWLCACTIAVTTPTAEATEALIGSTAGRLLARPATAHPGPATYPPRTLGVLWLAWARTGRSVVVGVSGNLVAGVVGGGGVRVRPRTDTTTDTLTDDDKTQNSTMRLFPCVPRLKLL